MQPYLVPILVGSPPSKADLLFQRQQPQQGKERKIYFAPASQLNEYSEEHQ